jgi:hypothetical protein
MSDIVERLRSSQPLPICPYDLKSPEYWTTPDDTPCKFCGGLPDGPDKCTGADTRIMGEAADEIERLRKALEGAYLSGFKASAEGWNGEHGPYPPEEDSTFIRNRDEFLRSIEAPDK